MLSIGQLAARTGLSVSAIRYYETQGLIEPLRNSGNQRRFLRSDIRRLSFVMIAQQFGFTIAQIKQQLDVLPNGRAPTRSDWEQMAGHFRAQLTEKISMLTELNEKLDGCIGCGCLSLDKCHLYNPKDSAFQSGTGPRFLMGDQPQKS